MAPAGRDLWDAPGLGEWSVRDLVGHTSRALLTVEAYLDRPANGVELPSAVAYYRRALDGGGDPAAVAQRGRDAGAALGADPAATVAEIADRVLRRLDAAAADALVATPFGGMRLIDYLPTRTFELTVHTCDLATAVGRPIEVPDMAARDSLHLLSALAAERGQTAPLLLAATGRGPLPPGFTVL
jgi:uncharacterized protein (TIGR03083 family)